MDVSYSSPDDPNCFQIITRSYSPYVLPKTQGKNMTYEGISVRILNEIFAKYNYCYNVTFANNMSFGQYFEEEDHYDGMLGEVQKQKYEMVLHPMSYTSDRMINFDLKASIGDLKWGIVYKFPSAQPDLLGFVRSFSWIGWCIIFSSLLFCSGYMLVEKSLTKRIYGLKETMKGNFTCVFSIVQIFLQQGTRLTVRRVSQLIPLVVFIFGSLVIALSYRSILKSMLIVPKFNVPFRNLQELVDQNEFKWTIGRGNRMHQYMMNSPNGSVYKKFSDGIKEFYNKAEDFTDAIDNKNVALLTAQETTLAIVSRGFTENGRCIRTVMEETLLLGHIGLIFKKNSTISSLMGRMMQYYKESGIFIHHMRRSIMKATSCVGELAKKSLHADRPLTLGDFYGVFSLLLAGYTMAFFLFICEILKFHLLNSKKESKGRTQKK